MREIEMLKFEMSELREFSVKELCDNKYFGGLENDDFDGNGVYKIEVGSRGEIEEVSKVEVVDGVFEVKSEEELLDSCECEEEREEMEDWVSVEMFEGVVSVCEFEEYGYDYVKIMID